MPTESADLPGKKFNTNDQFFAPISVYKIVGEDGAGAAHDQANSDVTIHISLLEQFRLLDEQVVAL